MDQSINRFMHQRIYHLYNACTHFHDGMVCPGRGHYGTVYYEGILWQGITQQGMLQQDVVRQCILRQGILQHVGNRNGDVSTPARRPTLLTIACESSQRALQLASHWQCRHASYVSKNTDNKLKSVFMINWINAWTSEATNKQVHGLIMKVVNAFIIESNREW